MKRVDVFAVIAIVALLACGGTEGETACPPTLSVLLASRSFSPVQHGVALAQTNDDVYVLASPDVSSPFTGELLRVPKLDPEMATSVAPAAALLGGIMTDPTGILFFSWTDANRVELDRFTPDTGVVQSLWLLPSSADLPGGRIRGGYVYIHTGFFYWNPGIIRVPLSEPFTPEEVMPNSLIGEHVTSAIEVRGDTVYFFSSNCARCWFDDLSGDCGRTACSSSFMRYSMGSGSLETIATFASTNNGDLFSDIRDTGDVFYALEGSMLHELHVEPYADEIVASGVRSIVAIEGDRVIVAVDSGYATLGTKSGCLVPLGRMSRGCEVSVADEANFYAACPTEVRVSDRAQ